MARMMMNMNVNPEEAAETTAAPVMPKETAAAAAPKADDINRYAHTFADWDLVPPQVIIRRVSRGKK